MTTRKAKAQPTLRYEMVKTGGDASHDGPSFSVVWRWLMGVFSGAMVLLMGAAMTWLWNTQGSLTTLTSAVSSNAESIRTVTSLLDRLQQSDAQQAATLAAVQVQLTNNQTNSTAANITLSARIESTRSELAARLDNMEKEARWRDRFSQQPAAKGGR